MFVRQHVQVNCSSFARLIFIRHSCEWYADYVSPGFRSDHSNQSSPRIKLTPHSRSDNKRAGHFGRLFGLESVTWGGSMICESCIGTVNALVAPLDGAARRPYLRFMESSNDSRIMHRDHELWISRRSAFGRPADLEIGDWLTRSRSFGPPGLAFALLRQSLSRFPKPLKSAGLETCATSLQFMERISRGQSKSDCNIALKSGNGNNDGRTCHNNWIHMEIFANRNNDNQT
jgi:hypothetical protein